MTTATNDALPRDPLFHEMYELVTASLRGDLADDDAARLEQLVCNDAGACDLYLEQIYVSRTLVGMASGIDKRPGPDELASNLESHSAAPMASIERRRTIDRVATTGVEYRNWYDIFERKRVFSLFTAALAVTALVLTMSYMRPPGGLFSWGIETPPQALATAESSEREVAAYLMRAVGCQWTTNQPLQSGAALCKRHTLELLAGYAELRFANGATALIEGPAKFTINSADGGYLERGCLVVKVSAQAIGFTIDTPTAKVVDLGTEFGIEVVDDRTLVQVFCGEVEVMSIDRPKPHPDAKRQLVRGGAAVIVQSNRIAPANAQDNKFTRSIPLNRWHVYDFERLTVSNGTHATTDPVAPNMRGQDGWMSWEEPPGGQFVGSFDVQRQNTTVRTGIGVNQSKVAGNPAHAEVNEKFLSTNAVSGTLFRVNNHHFSFIPFSGKETNATLQFDATRPAAGHGASVGLGKYDGTLKQNAAKEWGPVCGMQDYGDGLKIYLLGAGYGDETFSSQTFAEFDPNGKANDWYQFQLVMNFTANGGDGSGTVRWRNLSRGGHFADAPGLVDINLQLLKQGVPAPHRWDTMFARVDSYAPTTNLNSCALYDNIVPNLYSLNDLTNDTSK